MNPTLTVAIISVCISAVMCLFSFYTLSVSTKDKGNKIRIDIEIINTKLGQIGNDLAENKQDIKDINRKIEKYLNQTK